jgi:trans-aconitate methyltransferase
MIDVKDTTKFLIGRAAEIAMPSLGREIDEARNSDRAANIKRLILHSRLRRASHGRDTGAINTSIEKALSAYWKGHPGDQFHQKHADARLRLFLEIHSDVIEALAVQIAESPVRFTRIVEIGCGDGKVLSYCNLRLPDIPEAVGLDINAAVIERATGQYFGKPGLSFHFADATEWLTENSTPGTIILSNGGVLEYFSPASFDALLRSVSDREPAAIVLIEPVDPMHDLASDPESHVFGHERSFSHNHRYRLENAGFTVTYSREVNHQKVRWMTMIGMRTA